MKQITITGANDKCKLPCLTFGTESLGRDISYEAFIRLIERYRYSGGTCIDTDRMYADGKSEELIGRYLTEYSCRNHFLLSSKGGYPSMEEPDICRLTPEELTVDLNESLSLLGTDYLDIFFLSRDHPDAEFEKLMPFLHQLVTSGRVRFLGASNWTCDRIAAANDFAAENGLTPFSVSQIQWSLAECTPSMWKDDTIVCMNPKEFQYYETTRMPLMAYSPLARGLFSKLEVFGCSENIVRDYGNFLTPKNKGRFSRIMELAKQLEVTVSQLCHAYLYSGPLQASAVMGCTKYRFLDDSMGGQLLLLTKEQISYLDADDL